MNKQPETPAMDAFDYGAAFHTARKVQIIKKDGSATPKVAIAAPEIPATLYPIKVAEFIAIGPGVDSAIAIISALSDASALIFTKSNSL